VFNFGGFFTDVKGLIITLIEIYSYVVLIRVLLSWFNPNPHNPLVQFLRGVTDPALDTVRSFLPRFFWSTGIDFTPIVLFFLLKLVVIFLHRIFPAAG
jgi:YggT family protein